MNPPVCLVILDGFGIGDGGENDATALAKTPFLDRTLAHYPHAQLEASGAAVGLAHGHSPSSELGHRTLGAGRILGPDIVRVRNRSRTDELTPHGLGGVLSARGLRQLRIAETEKYAHVTCFFNGGRQEPFPGEDRILVPSPADIPSYDRKPEMSAVEVTDQLLEAMERTDYAFILVNYANPDMVGHTGVLDASVCAIEVIDACLDRLSAVVLARDGTLLISSDHGNIEQGIDPETGAPHTEHTTNPVPILWTGREVQGCSLRNGELSDVAVTLCELLELPAPEEMTGRSLLRCDPPSSS